MDISLLIRRSLHQCAPPRAKQPNTRRPPTARWIGASFGALLALLLSALIVSAQSSGDHQWRILTSDDGLLSNDIWSILVEEDAIWLGTDIGIARYDGAWTNYYNAIAVDDDDDSLRRSTLPSGAVIALAKSPDDGLLWAGTDTGEIAYWDGSNWSLAASAGQTLNALTVEDESVLLGTDHGLMRFSPGDQQLTLDEGLGDRAINALWSTVRAVGLGPRMDSGCREADGWDRIMLPEPLSSTPVLSLWQDVNGRLWLGTEQGALWYEPDLDLWSDELIPLFNERNAYMPVHAVTGDDAGVVWAGSIGGGARRIVADESITEDVSRTSGGGLTTPLVRDIALDDQGAVWFATPVGLFQFQDAGLVQRLSGGRRPGPPGERRQRPALRQPGTPVDRDRGRGHTAQGAITG